MSQNSDEILVNIKEKITEIILKFEKEKEETNKITEQNRKLQEQLNLKEKELEELEEKFKNAKLAGALSASGNGNEEAKKRITDLVREIDNCIALLNRV